MTGSSFFAGNGTNDVPFFIFACKTELYRSFLLSKSNIFVPDKRTNK